MSNVKLDYGIMGIFDLFLVFVITAKDILHGLSNLITGFGAIDECLNFFGSDCLLSVFGLNVMDCSRVCLLLFPSDAYQVEVEDLLCVCLICIDNS
jgi:hypothetical protein